jgi:outer membrane biosynthesis protein TonB
MDKYMYAVHPMRVVIIPDEPPFRNPKSIELTKDQVLAALPAAIVYRRFNADTSVVVTPGNIDRLHNAKFMTEEEYEEFKYNNKAGKGGTVIKEEKKEKVPEPEPVVEPTPVEEKVEEPVVEEPVVEEAPVEEPVEAPVEEPTEEAPVEEPVEEEVSEEESSEEKVQVNVGGKKKKK